MLSNIMAVDVVGVSVSAAKRKRQEYLYTHTDSVMFCGAGSRSVSRLAKRELWELSGLQRAWFNAGVATGLQFFDAGERIPGPTEKGGTFTILTQLRAADAIPDGMVSLQRPVFAAGIDAVKKFAKSRNKLEYSAGRSLPESEAALDLALMVPCDETLAAAHKAFRKLSRAEARLADHIDKGQQRLFRRRKDTETGALHPVLVHSGCRLRDGVLVLPGGVRIPVEEPDWAELAADGFEWAGGVQLIDMTDNVGRVTARTKPQHRKWMIRWALRTPKVPARVPVDADRVRGVDVGIVNQAVTDEAVVFDIGHDHAYVAAQQRATSDIDGLTRRMRRHRNGSRRHAQLARRRKAAQAKRNQRKQNAERHLAQALTMDDNGVPLQGVVMEDLQHTSLRASAAGTQDAPGTNVAAKSGLNRAWDQRAPARLSTFVERRCERKGIAFAVVDPRRTSLVCSRCSIEGDRESQAVFVCPDCGNIHADANAACNICNRGLEQWGTELLKHRKRAAGNVVLRRKPHRVTPKTQYGDQARPATPHSPAASQTTRHTTLSRANQTKQIRTRTLV